MPKIKIHYFSPDAPRLKMTEKGDWIDLYCAETMTLHAGDFALVPLGVSMQLPEGYEARTAPRSCTRSPSFHRCLGYYAHGRPRAYVP